MSGFEIAGLVLGAIPIILESIKIYNSGVCAPIPRLVSMVV